MYVSFMTFKIESKSRKAIDLVTPNTVSYLLLIIPLKHPHILQEEKGSFAQ